MLKTAEVYVPFLVIDRTVAGETYHDKIQTWLTIATSSLRLGILFSTKKGYLLIFIII
jgi:hypothetical protein